MYDFCHFWFLPIDWILKISSLIQKKIILNSDLSQRILIFFRFFFFKISRPLKIMSIGNIQLSKVMSKKLKVNVTMSNYTAECIVRKQQK